MAHVWHMFGIRLAYVWHTFGICLAPIRDKFVMNVVKDKTIGLVGFGDIAKATARLARAFGMKVIALRRSPEKGTEQGLADKVYGYEDRLQLFAKADFVVSVLPGTKETENFCGQQEFKAMKPEGVFINIGRGVAVDEDALQKALASKQVPNRFHELRLPSRTMPSITNYVLHHDLCPPSRTMPSITNYVFHHELCPSRTVPSITNCVHHELCRSITNYLYPTD